MRHEATRGGALLEVLIALTVLSIAGLALVSLTRTALDATDRAARVERDLLDMDRLMAAYTLLDRQDLGREVGRRLVGRYELGVTREGLDLFTIRIGHPGEHPELTTVLYRPEPGDAR